MVYDTQCPTAGGPTEVACDLPDPRPLAQAAITGVHPQDGREYEVGSLDEARRAAGQILGSDRIVEEVDQGVFNIELAPDELAELEREGYLSRSNAEYEIEFETP